MLLEQHSGCHKKCGRYGMLRSSDNSGVRHEWSSRVQFANQAIRHVLGTTFLLPFLIK